MKKIIFTLLIACFGIWMPSYGVIFGCLIMHNKETNKTLIFLPDVHSQSYLPNDEQLYKQASKQQSEIITLATTLKQRGVTVQLIVEDMASYQRKIYNFKDSQSICNCRWGKYYGPLTFLEEECIKYKLNCINAEFRDKRDPNYETEKTRITKNYEKILTLFKNYNQMYSEENQNTKDCPFFDAKIFEIINQNSSTFSIVCAGSGHIGTISKLMYKYGYTTTFVHKVADLDEDLDSHLTQFGHEKPISISGLFLRPGAFTGIDSAILSTLEENKLVNKL